MILEIGKRVKLCREEKSCIDLKQFEIHAKRTYLRRWFTRDWRNVQISSVTDGGEVSFPGNLMHISFDGMPPETLQKLEFTAEFAADTEAKLLVNSPAYTYVWIDGEFAFGRDGGIFLPAFHRAPQNQLCVRRFTKGLHRIEVGLVPFDGAQRANGAPLYVGFAAVEPCNKHLTGILR